MPYTIHTAAAHIRDNLGHMRNIDVFSDSVESTKEEALTEIENKKIEVLEAIGIDNDTEGARKNALDAIKMATREAENTIAAEQSKIMNINNGAATLDTETANMIAEQFNPSTNYVAGTYVRQTITEGSGANATNTVKLFRFITDHAAGSWIGTDAIQVNLSEEVADLKSALGSGITILNGSYVGQKWTNTNYTMFVEVTPGSPYTLVAPSSRSVSYYGLKTVNSMPPNIGDRAILSSAEGWTGSRAVTSGQTETGNIPDDVNYILFYAGTNTAYDRLPTSFVTNGYDVFGSAFDSIRSLKNNIKTTENDIETIENDIGVIQTLQPGCDLHPLQMFMNGAANLFRGEYSNHILYGYYRQTATSDSPKRIRVTPSVNYQGWLIPVKPNTTYAIGPVDFDVCFFGKDLSYDTRVVNANLSSADPNVVTSGANSYWMSITRNIRADMSEWMAVEGSVYPSEYVSGLPSWMEIPKHSKHTNRTIAFFGDSITAGSGVTGESNSQCYHQYLHYMYGYKCLNYAYGGSGYVKTYASKSETPGKIDEDNDDMTGLVGLHGQGNPGRGRGNSHYHFWPNNVLSMMQRMSDPNSIDDLEKIADPTSLSAVVIFAGTNDWSNNVSLSDFATGVDAVFDYYHANFGGVPLLVMTPIHRINDTTSGVANLSEYVDIIIQKCRDHGIPYIDTFTMSGLQPNNASNRAVFFPRDDKGNDGVHPNHLAHYRISRLIGETLNQMVLWTDINERF